VCTGSVKMHVDDTLAHTKAGTSFLAHTVSVLYVNVPSDMHGGQLETLGTREDVYGAEGGFIEKAPAAVITPMENDWVEFRGDALHQVRVSGRWCPRV
jgi:hypothetical protein